ncbi:MAG: RNA polymerase sigma factor [Deltaproteobacteria bacterium]|nr:RNA polymerase sigma factor [Deltaproteobacteria bacterium]
MTATVDLCALGLPVGDDEMALAQACAAGDRQAMARLYAQFHSRVYRLTWRMVGGAEAEELAHDVFLRVFRSLSRFRGEAALSTWIYRLTVNICLSFLAKRRRRRRLDDNRIDQPRCIEPREANPWLRDKLEQAISRLPDGYRAVLVLHDVEGLRHPEIAKILGCRVGTSKSQLHKARTRMRQLLNETSCANV